MARRRFRRYSSIDAGTPSWWRWPKRVVLSLLGLIALLGAGASGLVWMALPASTGTVHLPGLSAAVDIGFDTNGVPRIRATTERDAAMALGYVHARDRMFQMELMRRAASGRLSELAGPATLPLDKQMRLFGLAYLAEGDAAAQPPETQAILDAYAAGVNAWIAARGRFAAPEFIVLGPPEPWRPADSLLWGRTMGLWLSGNHRAELGRQALLAQFPRQTLESLWPPHPAPLPPEAGLPAPKRAAMLDSLPAFPAPFTLPPSASNAWAVDGRRTTTGAPLLAGDPHLNFGFPGLWYLVRVETPGQVLAGATAPGVPFLVLGHNGHVAWTFTTNGADTQDVFLEPANAIFAMRQETIRVRGQPAVTLAVRETRHGPVISDLFPGGGPVMSVAMANLRPEDTSASGLLALNHARTVEDAGKAAPVIASPVQNLMVADKNKIALFVTGRVPIRRAGDGWAPVPGGAGAEDPNGWTGFASGDALPHVVAPASGRLINANEPVVTPESRVFMGRDAFRDWRARRIRALLDSAGKVSATDFASMQMDTVSLYAREVLPILRGIPGAPRLLMDWDGAMTEDSPRPLLFSAWMEAFDRAVRAKAGLPADEAARAGAPVFDFVPFALSKGGAFWCGGDCRPLLKSSLDSTTAALSARFGPDPAAWRWGAVHRVTFAHPFLRHIPVLGPLTTMDIGVPGDGATIGRGGMTGDLEAVHGASFRGVYDLADLDRSLYVVTPGQSGHPMSRHAWDFVTRWHDGGMVLLGPRPAATEGTIRLEP